MPRATSICGFTRDIVFASGMYYSRYDCARAFGLAHTTHHIASTESRITHHPPPWTSSPGRKSAPQPVGNFRIFTIRSDRVISPRTQQAQDVYVIDCVNWVNVIAVTPDRHLVMIEQYRHGSTTVELEIPGGMMDAKDASPDRGGLARTPRGNRL